MNYVSFDNPFKDTPTEAVISEKQSLICKIFSCVDLVCAVVSSVYGVLPAFIMGVFSCFGFYAARMFNKSMILTYLLYQGIVLCSRIFLFVVNINSNVFVVFNSVIFFLQVGSFISFIILYRSLSF